MIHSYSSVNNVDFVRTMQRFMQYHATFKTVPCNNIKSQRVNL